MIALISFDDEIITAKEEAEKLNLQYKECQRVGTYDNKLVDMSSSYYYYEDELELRENEYYNDKDEKVSSYYVRKKPIQNLNYVKLLKESQLVNLEEFALKCPYRFYIEKCLKSEEPSISNINLLIGTIEEKMQQINKTIDIISQQTFNQKCDVHVGGGFIATYNDLMLKEDSCTDALQSAINDGWRIIAVCVQPNQRRPDYILGRYNPNMDTYHKSGAER